MLTAEFFTRNRRELRTKLQSGLVVLTASSIMQRNNDIGYPFRQESNFYYFTGVQEPGCILVLDVESDKEFLVLPQLSDVEIFFGGNIDAADLTQISGIQNVYDYKTGWNHIRELIAKRKTTHTLRPLPIQFTRQERMFSSPARRLLVQKIKRLGGSNVSYLQSEIVSLRSVKRPEEIAVIQKAIEVTKDGFKVVRNKMNDGVYEYELEAEFDYAFKKHNTHHGYAPPIIASGPNATILHYQKNTRQMKVQDLVLMDVGAEWSNYTADISRTYKVSGALTRREQLVYAAVEYVNQESFNLLRPGLSWSQYVIKVDKLMGEQLIRLGLITQNTREQVRKYFPHAISHSLGLDAHDICDYTQPMQENMVITIEAGIYIPEENIGVRIEDDVLLNKNGAVNLSSHIPYS